MQKRILLFSSITIILILLFSAIYYMAIYLPRKQKANLNQVKAEMEVKIEQEKTEREKIEQEMQRLEEEKQQKLEEEQMAQKLEKEEPDKKENPGSTQNNETERNSCLASAKKSYQKVIKQIGNDFDVDLSGNITPQGIISLQKSAMEAQAAAYERASTNYENAKNDCYHKYPLPNEDF